MTGALMNVKIRSENDEENETMISLGSKLSPSLRSPLALSPLLLPQGIYMLSPREDLPWPV